MVGCTRVTIHVISIVLTKISLIKKNGGAGKPQSKERGCKGANLAQIFRAELKKAFQKQLHKHKKHHANNSESDDDSNYSS